ncbi:MAG: PRC-barrel domain-containing protein [Pseudomonadota bacterium]
MKRLATLLLTTATLAVATVASAQVPDDTFLTAQQPNQYLAADLLLKAKVHDANGEIFGDVEDLILNANNQVEGVIIGIGGFLGVGEKRIGVRYSALQFTDKDGKTIVSLPQATPAVLKELPAYKRSRPPKSFLEGVTERAKEITAKSTETTKEALDEAKTQVGPALEQARQKAGEAYEKAKEVTQDALEKAKDATGTSQ